MPEPRQVVVFEHGNHPAVVLRVIGEYAIVALGTGTCHDPKEAIEVLPNRQDGMAMRLHKPTYFHSFDVKLAKLSGLRSPPSGGGRCPSGLFIRMELLFEPAVIALAARFLPT